MKTYLLVTPSTIMSDYEQGLFVQAVEDGYEVNHKDIDTYREDEFTVGYDKVHVVGYSEPD